MPGFRRHVFICLNQRAPEHPRGCCKDRGAEAVQARFKREVKARGLKDVVRANKAGCLDQCEHGVAVVVYPEQVWYGNVTADDVPEIVERHILGGEFVTRLMIPDQPHLGGATAGQRLDDLAHPEPAPVTDGERSEQSE